MQRAGVTMDIVLKRRNEIVRIAERYGASAVRVFGSVARGKNSPESDLDIVVRMEDDRSLVDHAALIRELEEMLGCPVDVVLEDMLDERIKQRVLSEAVSI